MHKMTVEPATDNSEDRAEPCEKVATATATDSTEMEGSHEQAPTLLQVIMSVLAAFGGVQNKKNKERDFKHGNFKVFAIVAALFTLLFLLSIFAVVQMVLK